MTQQLFDFNTDILKNIDNIQKTSVYSEKNSQDASSFDNFLNNANEVYKQDKKSTVEKPKYNDDSKKSNSSFDSDKKADTQKKSDIKSDIKADEGSDSKIHNSDDKKTENLKNKDSKNENLKNDVKNNDDKVDIKQIDDNKSLEDITQRNHINYKKSLDDTLYKNDVNVKNILKDITQKNDTDNEDKTNENLSEELSDDRVELVDLSELSINLNAQNNNEDEILLQELPLGLIDISCDFPIDVQKEIDNGYSIIKMNDLLEVATLKDDNDEEVIQNLNNIDINKLAIKAVPENINLLNSPQLITPNEEIKLNVSDELQPQNINDIAFEKSNLDLFEVKNKNISDVITAVKPEMYDKFQNDNKDIVQYANNIHNNLKTEADFKKVMQPKQNLNESNPLLQMNKPNLDNNIKVETNLEVENIIQNNNNNNSTEVLNKIDLTSKVLNQLNGKVLKTENLKSESFNQELNSNLKNESSQEMLMRNILQESFENSNKETLVEDVNLNSLQTQGNDRNININENHANVMNKHDVQNTDILEQIRTKFTINNAKGMQRVVIGLTPESLGKLTIEIVKGENGLSAQFLADNAQAKEILDKNIDNLKNILQSQGVVVNKLNVKVSEVADNFSNNDKNTSKNWNESQFNSNNKDDNSKNFRHPEDKSSIKLLSDESNLLQSDDNVIPLERENSYIERTINIQGNLGKIKYKI
ncbi:flagellar hook-length control protein FliK [bacterium]|nr:flagellar hook-length control protein FliK [bacterium]